MPSIGPISARIASAIFSGADTQGLGVRKNGDRKVPEFDLRRLFDDHAGQGDAGVLALQTLQHAQGKAMFEMTIQEVPLSC